MIGTVKRIVFATMAKLSRDPDYESRSFHQYPTNCRPNYVSSLVDESDHHFVRPLSTRKDASSIVTAILETHPESKLIYHMRGDGNEYIWFRVVVGGHNFYDDLKLIKRDTQIDVVSASRVGYSDLGINRKRIEHLRCKL